MTGRGGMTGSERTSVGFANSLGINGILSSGKASQGNNGESEDGTHVDDMGCFEED